jgi:hypothetical protein
MGVKEVSVRPVSGLRAALAVWWLEYSSVQASALYPTSQQVMEKRRPRQKVPQRFSFDLEEATFPRGPPHKFQQLAQGLCEG